MTSVIESILQRVSSGECYIVHEEVTPLLLLDWKYFWKCTLVILTSRKNMNEVFASQTVFLSGQAALFQTKTHCSKKNYTVPLFILHIFGFLNANWDRSKRVWDRSKCTFSKWTEIDLNKCEHFLKANWDRSKQVWTLSQSELRSI